jgi:SAM-dependent methyltransferase
MLKMAQEQTDIVDRYYEAMLATKRWPSRGSIERYIAFLFGGVSFANKTVLDIGGGVGHFSFYAAVRGARHVVCLEPETEGSNAKMRDMFNRIVATLNVSNVERLPITIQEFEAVPGAFDIVLLHNSVNHLDEEACINLRQDKRAADVYRGLFHKLATLMSDNGTLIIADRTPNNLFPRLGLKHPLSRSVEWHKHQPPEEWARLLKEAGFTDEKVRWSAFNSFGPLGWRLLANRTGAFFFKGHFGLQMRKQPMNETIR